MATILKRGQALAHQLMCEGKLPITDRCRASTQPKRTGNAAMPDERDLTIIEPLILTLRGQKVILDRDLAALYGVSTKRLNEQVRRNRKRFPDDFAFQLTKAEFEDWRSQFATSISAVRMG